MNQTDIALEAIAVGKRYRRGWALQNCSFSLPAGTVVALVGPNGAGKSTMMALAAGILTPTTGVIKVLGDPTRHRGPHPRLAFLSQDRPLYRKFSVDEMLHFGRAMNDHFDDHYARRLITESDIPLTARTGSLSGGQRTRVALALALGRRPAVLLLDEPLAALDPLARVQVMQTLMAEVVDTGIAVLMSSHVIADIEDTAEHLMLLAAGRLRLDGRVDQLLAEHWIATGAVSDDRSWIDAGAIVETRTTSRQVTTLVRDRDLRAPQGWTQDNPTLQELVLTYLRADGSASAAEMGRARGNGISGMNEVSMHRHSTVGGTSQSESGTHVVWVAWRQQRFQVLVSLSLIGAVALGLVFLRLNVVGALQDAGAQDCGNIAAFCASPGFDSVSDRYGAVAAIVPLIMLALPPLLGAFAGGPLFAREYELGTQILALTQSVGPVRWWATKTAVAGAPVALALLALGFVNTWAMQPMAAFVARPMITPGFETRGLTPLAYFVLAFAIAVTVGILVRNTAAAIGATIGLYIACLLVLGFVRPSYLAPVDMVEAYPPATGTAEPMDAGFVDAWVLDEYLVDAAGHEVTIGFGECADPRDAERCMVDHGVAGYLFRYQPVDRYWSIQVVESVIAVLAGAAILAVGALRLRRRVT